ncbi:MAG TPA: hypothetical protein VG142_03215 [Trebonia sp.]|jgi:hypothetical protein|nr:hypothetical protein [Trebonia sp.]
MTRETGRRVSRETINDRKRDYLKMTGEESRTPPEQRKHRKKWPPYDSGARIISYNLNEEERPGGVKIRFKIRIIAGKAAAAADRQQADAIKEYLKWVRQHRQSQNSEPKDTPRGGQDQPPSG